MWETKDVYYQMVYDALIDTGCAYQVWMAYAAEACLVDPLVLVVRWSLSDAVTIWLDWSSGWFAS
jgi:hypothetical protein